MFKKVISLFLSLSLIITQPIFAQGVAQFNLAQYLGQARPAAIDIFQPTQLRYFSYDDLNNSFRILLDKGDAKDIKDSQLKEQAKELMDYFLIGLALPNDTFWVNLRPDSQDNIIDPALERTDLGRILLEADLQLKKDTAGLTSPQTPEGKAYWDKLYKKVGELFGTENITIPTITRPWIVPGEIIVRESGNSAYIYKATLKVLLEQDHLKDSSVYNFSDPRLKELNEYSSQIIRETIIPKLTQEVNSSKRYAKLRQVYYSLVLSRWFKQKYSRLRSTRASEHQSAGMDYISLIDSGNLTNLIAKEPYDKLTYFKQYQESFAKGEYSLKEPVYTPYGQSIRTYMSGGFNAGNKAMIISGVGATVGSSIVGKSLENTANNIVPLEISGNSLQIEFTNQEQRLAIAASPLDIQEEINTFRRNFESYMKGFSDLNIGLERKNEVSETLGGVYDSVDKILSKIEKDIKMGTPLRAILEECLPGLYKARADFYVRVKEIYKYSSKVKTPPVKGLIEYFLYSIGLDIDIFKSVKKIGEESRKRILENVPPPVINFQRGLEKLLNTFSSAFFAASPVTLSEMKSAVLEQVEILKGIVSQDEKLEVKDMMKNFDGIKTKKELKKFLSETMIPNVNGYIEKRNSESEKESRSRNSESYNKIYKEILPLISIRETLKLVIGAGSSSSLVLEDEVAVIQEAGYAQTIKAMNDPDEIIAAAEQVYKLARGSASPLAIEEMRALGLEPPEDFIKNNIEPLLWGDPGDVVNLNRILTMCKMYMLGFPGSYMEKTKIKDSNGIKEIVSTMSTFYFNADFTERPENFAVAAGYLSKTMEDRFKESIIAAGFESLQKKIIWIIEESLKKEENSREEISDRKQYLPDMSGKSSSWKDITLKGFVKKGLTDDYLEKIFQKHYKKNALDKSGFLWLKTAGVRVINERFYSVVLERINNAGMSITHRIFVESEDPITNVRYAIVIPVTEDKSVQVISYSPSNKQLEERIENEFGELSTDVLEYFEGEVMDELKELASSAVKAGDDAILAHKTAASPPPVGVVKSTIKINMTAFFKAHNKEGGGNDLDEELKKLYHGLDRIFRYEELPNWIDKAMNFVEKKYGAEALLNEKMIKNLIEIKEGISQQKKPDSAGSPLVEFVTGGVNSNKTIDASNEIGGTRIEEIENRANIYGLISGSGFKDIMKTDNTSVLGKNLNHQMLAAPLLKVLDCNKNETRSFGYFEYNGKIFSFKTESGRIPGSIFDDNRWSNLQYTVINLDVVNLRNALKNYTLANKIVLKKFGLSIDEVDTISEGALLQVFDKILNKIQQLLSKTRIPEYGLDDKDYARLKRELLEIIYPQTQKTITFLELLPYYIHDYGFYGGSKAFRLEPKDIIDFFGITASSGLTSESRPSMSFGGIDFTSRAMRIGLEPMGSFADLKLVLPEVANGTAIDLDNEFKQIQLMASSGIRPSDERILEFTAACYYQGEFGPRMGEITSCLQQAHFLDERLGRESSPALRLATILPEVM